MASLVVLLAIVGIANASVIKTPEVHFSMSEEELMHYFEVRSVDQVPEYHITDLEVVTDDGIKVDRAEREWPTTDGVIVERAEPESVTDGGDPFDRMGQREAVTEGYAFKRSTEDQSEMTIKIDAFGKPLQIELRKTEGLLVPAFIVHEVEAQGPSRINVRSAHSCYHGKVSERHNSRAALCNFDGMSGVVHVDGEEIVVQPLRHGYDSRVRREFSDNVDPHIVYKRQAQVYDSYVDDTVMDQSETTYRRDAASSGRKHLETMVVADHTVFDYYGDMTENYILTVMNVISGFFRDPSFGVDVEINLVKLVILKADVDGFPLSDDAVTLVSSFCKYQRTMNTADDSDPSHSDISVLLSRRNIGIGGVAYANGACDPGRQCALVRANGLSSVFSGAHEIAHLLHVGHDGDNGCAEGVNIMSTTVTSGGKVFEWSSCSATQAQAFFSSSASSCFNDDPISSVVIDTSLTGQAPGIVYNRTMQCKFIWGWHALQCWGDTTNCVNLMCTIDSSSNCHAYLAPPMEGTQCAERKWCIKGQCVDFGAEGPAPINGGWSDYDADYSSCSRSCGGGIQTKRRYCTNPKPQYGGQPCTGRDEMYQMCNLQDCSVPPTAFANQHCSKKNKDGKTFVPYYGYGDDSFCDGWCISGSVVYGAPRFEDGTPCNFQSNAYRTCVQGKCLSFGCDGQENSDAAFDNCGVCKGSGDRCEKVEGTVNQGKKGEYMTVLTVPAGSTNLKVVDTSLYCVLGLKFNGSFVLGGALSINIPRNGIQEYANNVFMYSGSYEHENITVPGVIPVELEVQVFQQYPDYYGSVVRPKIAYSYYRPKSVVTTPAPIVYNWKRTEGACSITCGTGTKQPTVACIRETDGQAVDDSNCDSNTRPSSDPVPCSMPDCPQPQWNIGDWGECSVSCDEGVKTRQVTCRSGEDASVIVPDGQCQSAKPATTEKCEPTECNAGGCLYEPDTLRPGYSINDGSQNKVANRDECCQSCRATSGCTAWSFFKDPNSASYRECWLKKPWSNGQKHQTYVDSGLMDSKIEQGNDGCRYQTNILQVGLYINGSRYFNDGMTNVVATREECCVKCHNEPGCKAFAFVKYPGPRFGECWYINTESSVSDNACCDGGVLTG